MTRYFFVCLPNGDIIESFACGFQPELGQIRIQHPNAVLIETDKDKYMQVHREQEFYKGIEKREIRSKTKTERDTVNENRRQLESFYRSQGGNVPRAPFEL